METIHWNDNQNSTNRFSVIIPVYNAEKTLNRCIDSILQQTFTDYEVIIIDDGSLDNSVELCDQYAFNHYKVKVYHQKNQGAFVARNNAIRFSQGQFCVFLDSDDWLQEKALEIIDKTITKYACDVVMYNYYCVSDSEIWSAPSIFMDGSIFTSDNKAELLTEFFVSDNINSMWTKAIKRENLLCCLDSIVLPQRVTMGEDVIQSIGAYRNFNRLVYINAPLVYYYINKDGITRSVKADKYYLDTNIVFKYKKKFLEETGLRDSSLLYRFTEHYLLTIANHLLNIQRSKLSKKDELRVFKNIRSSEVFKDMLGEVSPHVLSSEFPRSYRYAISLLASEKYKLLYFYVRIIDYYVHLRSNTHLDL